MTIEGRQGGLLLSTFGHAGPRKLDIDFRMGGAQLDLRGGWAEDAAIDLDIGLSDVVLRLPRNANVEGVETGERAVGAQDEIAPTLSFAIAQGLRGSLKVFD